METIKLKTTVNCYHCLSKITPFLNQIKEISDWSVDLADPDKVLSVSGEDINPEKIIDALSKAGYSAVKI
jgi:copper chaperone CopZ